MRYKPHDYQEFATDHILDNDAAGLFMEMGLGKTVATLSAIDILMYERFEINKCLVIAPKFVALNVWTTEAKKWNHLRHLRISVITGNVSQRIKALKTKADIYVLGRDSVTWLVNYYSTGFPYDMMVLDELSSFKSAKSQRFKSLKTVRPLVSRVVGLTGTPSPNTVADLWPQVYLLDQGERLGKSITAFREAYLRPEIQKGHVVFKYGASKEDTKKIHRLIKDICISMKAKDYLDLPPCTIHDVEVDLGAKLMRDYKQFEKTKVLEYLEDTEISALGPAALVNKLLQYASGSIYDDDGGVHWLHDKKLEALQEIIERAGDQPVLVFYGYKHGLARIVKRFGARKLKTEKDIRDWNKGRIPLMIAHAKSAGHGLNLQAGGSIIVWFGVTWSLEEYLQANARLHRQGQLKPVNIYRILCRGTRDMDVARALSLKNSNQEALMKAVKALIKEHGKESKKRVYIYPRQSVVRAKKLSRSKAYI